MAGVQPQQRLGKRETWEGRCGERVRARLLGGEGGREGGEGGKRGEKREEGVGKKNEVEDEKRRGPRQGNSCNEQRSCSGCRGCEREAEKQGRWLSGVAAVERPPWKVSRGKVRQGGSGGWIDSCNGAGRTLVSLTPAYVIPHQKLDQISWTCKMG
ncbi:hypothetical protein ASPZODRAFT_136487 [Penicilliopsis zonata CBS 506.65]|uniref:Uncharacterized protein n=1 Tax=Penicilliopsis zonata CBS 506.65 TaxID=1073090 RepID=A0A1L9S7Y4_9EURO|nr:hypothetical protein ASPZODRAFT_136487 [Penicilliopsis zonata CBS 506.65]OJJ43273.1 hypothetical protein ASPZODRAFT_136487 [Penicilliopsis zonata CBS 506.65]